MSKVDKDLILGIIQQMDAFRNECVLGDLVPLLLLAGEKKGGTTLIKNEYIDLDSIIEILESHLKYAKEQRGKVQSTIFNTPHGEA